jgi:hypothetical protein
MQPDRQSSSGGRQRRSRFFVPCVGIFGTRYRCAMSKSCSPSAVWRRITRPSGVGFHVTGANCEERLRRHLEPTNKSWRVDEDLYSSEGPLVLPLPGHSIRRAPPSLSAPRWRDRQAPVRKALGDPSHPQPRVINTDQVRLYCSAKAEGTLRRRCRHRPVQYLNNILKQDHRAIKRRVKAKQSFRGSQQRGERIVELLVSQGGEYL